jgi:hypothetical protein
MRRRKGKEERRRRERTLEGMARNSVAEMRQRVREASAPKENRRRSGTSAPCLHSTAPLSRQVRSNATGVTRRPIHRTWRPRHGSTWLSTSVLELHEERTAPGPALELHLCHRLRDRCDDRVVGDRGSGAVARKSSDRRCLVGACISEAFQALAQPGTSLDQESLLPCNRVQWRRCPS